MDEFQTNNAVMLEDFNYWQNRKLYLQLLEKFVNGRIDGRQFDSEFCRMWRVDRDKKYSLQELELFDKIDDVGLTKFQGFSALMSDLFIHCDVFEPDPSLREGSEISEDELRNFVKKTFLEIKDRYP